MAHDWAHFRRQLEACKRLKTRAQQTACTRSVRHPPQGVQLGGYFGRETPRSAYQIAQGRATAAATSRQRKARARLNALQRSRGATPRQAASKHVAFALGARG